MLKKNVVMIVNPVSGGIDKSEFIQATSNYATSKNLNFILYSTTGKDDIQKIRDLYMNFNPERVIIAGGDGTIKLVAEALENEDIIVGILPAGSSNGLATDLYLIKSLEENLKIAFQNHFIAIDIININGQKSLHLSDLGLNAKLIENYQKSAVRGKWGYAVQIFNTLLHADKPFEATITSNDKLIECKVRMIVIANSQKYGTGVVINPNGLVNDGKFELVILKNLNLFIFGKIISGRMPVSPDDIVIISTDKATIKLDRPVSFQIDGEYYGTETELDIVMSPNKLKVAIP
jgi:YegS/Rv2252/BmrU family lipid kinase